MKLSINTYSPVKPADLNHERMEVYVSDSPETVMIQVAERVETGEDRKKRVGIGFLVAKKDILAMAAIVSMSMGRGDNENE